MTFNHGGFTATAYIRAVEAAREAKRAIRRRSASEAGALSTDADSHVEFVLSIDLAGVDRCLGELHVVDSWRELKSLVASRTPTNMGM